MSRVIKFRAWVPAMNQMQSDPKMGTMEAMSIISLNDSLAQYGEGIGSAVLMQFTGLTDKNGKEIYEGDVLRCNDTFREAVHYSGDGFWSSTDMATFRVRLSDWATLEVIGNIYENPKLLTYGA